MIRCEHCGSVLDPRAPDAGTTQHIARHRHTLDREHWRVPSFREVADRSGRSMSTVAEHVKHLRAKGLLIPAEHNASFALVLTEAGRAAVGPT